MGEELGVSLGPADPEGARDGIELGCSLGKLDDEGDTVGDRDVVGELVGGNNLSLQSDSSINFRLSLETIDGLFRIGSSSCKDNSR